VTRARAALAALLAAGAGFAACNDAPVRAFLARRWEPALGCLDRSEVLDVVTTDAGTCAPHCLVQHGDAGTVTWLTLECPPWVPGVDTSESDPTCKQAHAAFDRGDTCLPDGGQTNPPPKDAAAE